MQIIKHAMIQSQTSTNVRQQIRPFTSVESLRCFWVHLPQNHFLHILMNIRLFKGVKKKFNLKNVQNFCQIQFSQESISYDHGTKLMQQMRCSYVLFLNLITVESELEDEYFPHRSFLLHTEYRTKPGLLFSYHQFKCHS